MPDKVRIALDVMGGDHGAPVILPGADISLTRHPDIEFLLFGNSAAVQPVLDKLPRLKAHSKVVHTEIAIRMDDKPSQALRYGRWKSSMWLATSVCTTFDFALTRGNFSSTGSIAARLPKSRYSMSGWRVSEMSAPGNMTAAPWSPPMASSAMRTLSGMDRSRR